MANPDDLAMARSLYMAARREKPNEGARSVLVWLWPSDNRDEWEFVWLTRVPCVGEVITGTASFRVTRVDHIPYRSDEEVPDAIVWVAHDDDSEVSA